jgi:glucosamine 6-phosphate synthetase-like amidotransferase/phosphosugar isomerase protein
MNIEQIRADIFRLFDIKVDKDDPIWAFLYANREVIRNLEDILDLSKSENKEYHKLMQIELEEFSKVAKESVRESIEQFDFRVTEFSQNISGLEKINNDLIFSHNRFKNDITNGAIR